MWEGYERSSGYLMLGQWSPTVVLANDLQTASSAPVDPKNDALM